MGQVLYRKYRSRSFDEIVGQDHITDVLRRAISQSKVAHAYLFTGPRGVGKTSVARILAHEINQLPYSEGEEQAHLDIIEIDAASNRRIDEIRDLREKVHLAPTLAKYKVYIIDEVHMLTTEAFNALLKTLEEPPEHVIFILATTEAHKVPETIISRTQRFHFRPIDAQRLAEHLSVIAQQESISITSEALRMLAVQARGSFRDGLSLLDQVGWQKGKVTAETVESLLGLPPTERVDNLLTAILSGDIAAVFATLAVFYEQGISAGDIARSLSQAARERYVAGDETAPLLIDIAEGMLGVEESFDPLVKLETSLVRITSQAVASSGELAKEVVSPLEKVAEVSKPTPATPDVPEKPKIADHVSASGAPGTFDWPKLLESIKAAHEPLYALLRMCEAEYNPKTNMLTLTFRFGFHQKRTATDKNRQLLLEAATSHLGTSPELALVVDTTSQPPKPSIETNQETVESAADILGGDIVELESA